jgi:hypothetical protein
MTIKIDTAVEALKSDPLADPDSIMKPKGRELVRNELANWKQKNLRGHVVVVGKGDPFGTPDDIDALWKKLGYDDDHDLILIVAQGRGFACRGWGQQMKGPSRNGTIADEAVAILRELGGHAKPQATTPTTTPSSGTTLQHPPAPPPPTPAPIPATRAAEPEKKKDDGGGFPVLPVLGGTVVVIGGGLIALAIRRRRKLAKEGSTKLGAMKATIDKTYADVVLACEDLPGDPQATELQLKAAELKKRADAIAADVEAAPHTGTDPVVLGKLEQLENELGALRSTVLQKRSQGALPAPSGIPNAATAKE